MSNQIRLIIVPGRTWLENQNELLTAARLNQFLQDASIMFVPTGGQALPIGVGGTGGNTAGAARTALGLGNYQDEKNDFAADADPDGSYDTTDGWSEGSRILNLDTSNGGQCARLWECFRADEDNALWREVGRKVADLARDPLPGDDITQGFRRYSMVRNTVSGEVFLCADNSESAAVWKRITNDTASSVVGKYDAILPPAVTDDEDSGYGVGSPWIDTVLKQLFICFDPADDAADWDRMAKYEDVYVKLHSGEQEVSGTPTTQIDFTDLNLTTGLYMAQIEWVEGSGVAGELRCRFSNSGDTDFDTTDTNYDSRTQHDGTNQNRPIVSQMTGSGYGWASMWFRVVNGHVCGFAHAIDASAIKHYLYGIVHTGTTAPSPMTRLRFYSEQTNGLGVGTKARVVRVG